MKNDKILIDHGSGGKLSHDLVQQMILPVFDNSLLSRQDDGAVFQIGEDRFAFSTDTFVVTPLFFPGGNIGELAVNGTVNDLAMCGATPLFLSAGFIIEEGFSITDLEKVISAMKKAADVAGVAIVTGDTKVVPIGAADQLFINTSGIGRVPDHVNISGRHAMPGDKIIVSGTIGDHAAAILIKREGLPFETPILSDTASLNHLVKKMLDASDGIHVLRDPTRGGLGTTLNEIAIQSNTGILISEDRIPVKKSVSGICGLLGFDPMYLANEGKLVAVVRKDDAEQILQVMKNDSLGKDACIIGEVVSDYPGKVMMTTHIGGTRFVDMLTGEQLPRIC
ncbi:MAG: hydrogenase expression/formation protein HypE [Proteobacteria bacterium]|nr:hydrogenase expression/formation protein HypE [Pseudomonadota bacterium]